jgi:hypothetical protein
VKAPERRVCELCRGYGFLVVSGIYDDKTDEYVEKVGRCWVCKGWGIVPLFVVEPLSTTITKSTLRKMDDNQVWMACWLGDARERKHAELELRKRERHGK